MEDCDGFSDPVFDDLGLFMNDVDKRKKLFDLCRRSHRDRDRCHSFPVNEWNVCVALLVQMGIVDLDEDHINSDLIFAWREKRISKLCLRNRGNPCDLPAAGVAHLARLTNLESLHLQNVQSIPLKELSLLPHLWRLEFTGLFPKGFGSEEQAQAKNPDTVGPSPSFTMSDRFVALERLRFNIVENSDIDYFLHALSSSNFCFFGKVKEICFTQHDTRRVIEMQGHHLETLLFQVLPRFPNIRELEIDDTRMGMMAFKVVVDRIRSGKPYSIPKFLNKIGIFRLNFDKQCDTEMALLTTFLDTFHTVDSFTYRGCDRNIKLAHALAINRARRKVLQGVGGKWDGDGNLPLSVWPDVIHRTQRMVDKRYDSYWDWKVGRDRRSGIKASAMYDLLRQGPVLLCRGGSFGTLGDNPSPPKRQCSERSGACMGRES